VQYLDIDGTAKKISKIGLGTAQFASEEWGYGESYARTEALSITRRALGLGVTLFDTAEIYGSGRSERILRQALGDRRDEVVLATKVFPVLPSALAVRQRAAASARRLGVSHLDLYQVHFPNPLVGDPTIMRGMRALRRSGLVGDVGVSNYSLARWQDAERALRGPVLSNQVPYSLLNRSAERDLLPWAQAHGRVIIAFGPLAKGLLSGRFHEDARPGNPTRLGDPRFGPAGLARTAGLISLLREIAAVHAATPAQIALAWVIHHPAVTAIPGASTVAQLESNVAAAEIALADDEYQALASASAGLGSEPEAEPGGRPPVVPALKHSVRGAALVARAQWRDLTGRG
jgi:aryl-alcohol dehydrogenase-like predicted oxidoreductase